MESARINTTDLIFYLQLADGIAVQLRLAIRRRAGSNPRALSLEVAGLNPLLFCTAFLKPFLVNRKNINPLVGDVSNSPVALRNNPSPLRWRAVVQIRNESFSVS